MLSLYFHGISLRLQLKYELFTTRFIVISMWLVKQLAYTMIHCDAWKNFYSKVQSAGSNSNSVLVINKQKSLLAMISLDVKS